MASVLETKIALTKLLAWISAKEATWTSIHQLSVSVYQSTFTVLTIEYFVSCWYSPKVRRGNLTRESCAHSQGCDEKEGEEPTQYLLSQGVK